MSLGSATDGGDRRGIEKGVIIEMTVEEVAQKFGVPAKVGRDALDYRDRHVVIERASSSKDWEGLVCRQTEREGRFILLNPLKLTYLGPGNEKLWEPPPRKRINATK